MSWQKLLAAGSNRNTSRPVDDNKDLTLPYLLVAFAGRMLANKESVTLPIEALQTQGYDTEVLVEMVAHYNTLPLSNREFAISTKGAPSPSVDSSPPVSPFRRRPPLLFLIRSRPRRHPRSRREWPSR